MEVKTSDLTLLALDWAVAKCEGKLPASYDDWTQTWPHYSTNWAQGGPIIEREKMGVWSYYWNEQGEFETGWYAENEDGNYVRRGPTPLISAMRCYVASKLGDTVDVPTELLGD
jgi:hypothetical protein